MIRAGMVGLGWWGKTIVESAAASDEIAFVAATTRTLSDDARAFCDAQGLRVADDYEALLADDELDAVVLATPHSLHADQVVAAAAAGKHVFCEKPFALTKADAQRAVAATQAAGVTLGLGYNRRFHPEMIKLRERIDSGELGTILHVEATMTFPNALALTPDAWRAHRDETPAGGLTPMGVHAIDGMIDLCGPIDHVVAQSFRRVVAVDSDDTTSVLLRMRDGMSGYLGTMTATGPGFSFQVFGSGGWVRLEGMTHVAGASSEERRTRLFGDVQVPARQGRRRRRGRPSASTSRARRSRRSPSRRRAASPYPIPLDEMVHGAAVTEAIVRATQTGQTEKVS